MTFPEQTSVKISISELAQMRKEESQIWPDDLVEDMEESDPHVYQQVQRFKELLADKRQELKHQEEVEQDIVQQPSLVKPQKPVFAKDTLVVPGWDKVSKKRQKNWSDFENLMYLYALDKLFTAETMPAKAKQDKVELTYVVEEFDRLKRPKRRKHDSAEKRLTTFETYVDYGKRTIDASCQKDEVNRACDLHDLEREYEDAIDGNKYNGWKMKKAYHIARRAIKTLRQRY